MKRCFFLSFVGFYSVAKNVMKKKAIPTLSFYNSFNMMDNGQEGISLNKE